MSVILWEIGHALVVKCRVLRRDIVGNVPHVANQIVLDCQKIFLVNFARKRPQNIIHAQIACRGSR